jgi:hypothetical protein
MATCAVDPISVTPRSGKIHSEPRSRVVADRHISGVPEATTANNNANVAHAQQSQTQ